MPRIPAIKQRIIAPQIPAPAPVQNMMQDEQQKHAQSDPFMGASSDQFKGHELAFGPALQDAVAMGAVFGIGVVLLRHAVDVLEFERLRAL